MLVRHSVISVSQCDSSFILASKPTGHAHVLQGKSKHQSYRSCFKVAYSASCFTFSLRGFMVNWTHVGPQGRYIPCSSYSVNNPVRLVCCPYHVYYKEDELSYCVQEEEAADIARKVLQAVKIMGWQMGKTRVFLRAGQLAQLEVTKSASVLLSQVFCWCSAAQPLRYGPDHATKKVSTCVCKYDR